MVDSPRAPAFAGQAYTGRRSWTPTFNSGVTQPGLASESSTVGAYVRQELGVVGSASRLYENSDLAITGNDPLFAGVARWAYGLSGSVAAMVGPKNQQEYAALIDESVDDVYSSVLVDLFGYTPVEGAYRGPVPPNIAEHKASEFLQRINAESTLEGRNAILFQIQQEARDREAISRAGIAKLLAVGLLALPFDESFWIDLYVTKGALKLNRVQQMARMHKIIGAAGLGAVGAGVSGGIREAVLFKGQYTRTAEEVLRNIKIEAAFGGIMGGAIGTMSTAYRAAVRARYGADTVHDAIVTATDSIAANLASNPRLAGRVTNLLDAFQADRNIDDAVLDSVLDDVLDGSGNQHIVELVGLRKGTWRNSLLNKFFFLTPNIRFASSRLTKPRELIDQLTNTGLAKEGGTGGTSLERLKILMEVQQDASRMEAVDIFRLAESEGSNIKDQVAFDRAVEMLYRRDPTGTFDVPDRIEYSDRGVSINVLELTEPINARGKKALKAATQKFQEEQKVYDLLAVQSGYVDANSMAKIRKFYRDTHGENFVHRIIDRDAVFADREAVHEAVMRGLADLHAKRGPELQAEITALRAEIDRVRLAESNGADSTQAASEIERLEIDVHNLEVDLQSMVPDATRASNIVGNWMASADGYIRPSMSTGERTVLIKDEFLEPWLIQSVEAQRSAFYSNTGLKGIAFQKLGSRESLKYVRRSIELHQKMDELDTKIAGAPDAATRDRYYNQLQEHLEEIDVITQSARLYNDMRLATTLDEATLGLSLNKVRTMERRLLNASRTGNRSEFNRAVAEFNTTSKEFVGTHALLGDPGTKASGKISEHKDIRIFRNRGDAYVGMDAEIRSALSEDPMVMDARGQVRAARVESLAERNRIQALEIGDNSDYRNFRMEASMEREVAAGGYKAKDTKELKRIINDLKVINERIMGVRGSDPSDPWKNLGPLFRNYNYMTSMGAVTLSSFPDVAMGVFTSGLGPYVSSLYRYGRHTVKRMVSSAEPDEKFFMMDMTHSLEANATGARIREIMQFKREGAQDYSRQKQTMGKRIYEASKSGSEAMTRYSLLGSWNGFWKAVNNGAAASRIGRIANKLGAGRNVSKSDRRFLDMLGLNEVDVKDMDVLYKTFGRTESTGLGAKFHYTMSQSWQGAVGNLNSTRVAQLKSRLNGSLSLNSDLSIVTPGAGSLPSMVDKSEGFSMIFQFKRFFFTATENVLLPMIQRGIGRGEGQALMAGAGLIFMGGLVTAAKSVLKGQDPFPHISLDAGIGEGFRRTRSTKQEYYNNVVSLMVNAVDRSGILGIMADPMNIASKAGYDPIQIISGGSDSLGRAKSKPILEMLGGPTAGKAQTMFEAAGSMIGLLTGVDKLTPAATKDFMALVPFQNLLPFTMVANTSFSLLEANDKAERQMRIAPDLGAKTAADFYYDQFRFIEHRLAPLLVETDYSNYSPRTAIVQ